MEIQAAVVEQAGSPFQIQDLRLDEPRETEVLVRVMGSGICHTDLAAAKGQLPVVFPAVLGHEGAGVVDRVGSRVTRLKPGDEVVLTWGACGVCGACRIGRPAHCDRFFKYNLTGRRPDGTTPLRGRRGEISGAFFGQSSFASHVVVDERNAVPVPPGALLERLGPLGCGVMTGAGAVVCALKAGPGSSLAVFGAGAVGLSAVMAAALSGCDPIIAVDVLAIRLEMARELGATHTVQAGQKDPVGTIRSICPGGVDFSLECVGDPEVLSQAVACLRPMGVCGLVGMTPPGTRAFLDMNTLLAGRTVRGIVEGDAVPHHFIPRMLAWHEAGRFPFHKLLSFYPLSHIQQAVKDMRDGRVIKPVLIP
ncbi:aryl-alcohol dehydrogenase [Desulfacinum hydrothermale DSM 13146]|uniref:Aryl-alcohol dehydrogenase n=1 Tax=Desulfacinum hydrothermale DSM 13146 TaxID=1121390 RepID=A0A1W1X995_9BACT|nr:NAD(P)-dependent alcohol dehydrogenase [Desulfacinum hydrothermale]SMC20228.1 aryl-alcohol dehydrogenase [Desulfacinum hydrothermale DSM 13146]